MKKSNNICLQAEQPKQISNSKFLLIILVALFSAFVLNIFVFANVRIIGQSMSPLLNEKDWVIANRLTYNHSDPAFGDIIIFKKTDLTKETIVKRVIGTPLDTVEIKDGCLYINDKLVENDFASMDVSENMSKVTVPENCYFLLGDNRAVSNDSRDWDNPFVRREEIIGKVVFRYFPELSKVK